MIPLSNLTLIIFITGIVVTFAALNRCYSDCGAQPHLREVGPTRPYFERDPLGEKLSLTRPHPYAFVQTQVLVTDVKVNVTVRLQIDPSKLSSDETTVSNDEKILLVNIWRGICLDHFHSNQVSIEHEPHSYLINGGNFTDIKMSFNAIAELNGYDGNQTSQFVTEKVVPTLLIYFSRNVPLNVTSFLEATDTSGKDLKRLKQSQMSLVNESNILFEAKEIYQETSPNIYAKFCNIGCSFFFSANETKNHSNDEEVTSTISPAESTLSSCLQQCDTLYNYNISVGYNDLLEVARLECRDGCIIALNRCQPGYYCIQPSAVDISEEGINYTVFVGGGMHTCPPGTYRDFAYEEVTQCLPCPPGRYREGQRGENLESCRTCPEKTFNPRYGATSIQNCSRCPAGTFNDDTGASKCNCITPMSCDTRYDAEMRDTIPFIGRW